jgi:hypothetical protein
MFTNHDDINAPRELRLHVRSVLHESTINTATADAPLIFYAGSRCLVIGPGRERLALNYQRAGLIRIGFAALIELVQVRPIIFVTDDKMCLLN